MNFLKHVKEFRQDLEDHRYAKSTIESYCKVIYKFLQDFEPAYKEPKAIPETVIKQYLRESPSDAVLRHRIGALKRFYKFIIRQPLKFKYIEYPKRERKYPIILSIEETKRLFEACTNLKHYTIMLVAYATGVRVSELLNIQLSDIDRANGVIHIRHGKGAKQRQVTMKPELLKQIEKYYRAFRPNKYLFEGENGKYTASSINQFLRKYAELAGIKKRVHIHLIRHLYATHSLEAGENLYTTQKCLGHASPKTTADFYYHISPSIVSNAYSPINNLHI